MLRYALQPAHTLDIPFPPGCRSIKTGTYPVRVKDHVLVLNWSHHTIPLLRQYDLARKYGGNDEFYRRPVVLLAVRAASERVASTAHLSSITHHAAAPLGPLAVAARTCHAKHTEYRDTAVHGHSQTLPAPTRTPPLQDMPKQDMDNEIAERLKSTTLDVITRSGSPAMVGAERMQQQCS